MKDHVDQADVIKFMAKASQLVMTLSDALEHLAHHKDATAMKFTVEFLTIEDAIKDKDRIEKIIKDKENEAAFHESGGAIYKVKERKKDGKQNKYQHRDGYI